MAEYLVAKMAADWEYQKVDHLDFEPADRRDAARVGWWANRSVEMRAGCSGKRMVGCWASTTAAGSALHSVVRWDPLWANRSVEMMAADWVVLKVSVSVYKLD